MNAIQLEFLIEAAQGSSFAEVARKYFVTPQAVSKAIKQLEKELKVPLFTKEGNNMIATPAGKDLADRSYGLIKEFEILKLHAQTYKSRPTLSGKIKLAVANLSLRGVLLPRECLVEFSQIFPEIEIEAFTCSPEACFAAVENDLADAAIALDQEQNDSFECHPIAAVAPALLMDSGNKLSSKRQIELDDLNGSLLAATTDIAATYQLTKGYLESQCNPIEFALAGSTPEEADYFLRKGGVMLILDNSPLIKLLPNISVVPFNRETAPGPEISMLTQGPLQEELMTFYEFTSNWIKSKSLYRPFDL